MQNHIVQVQLAEYAIPIIESLNKIIKDEETEYQGVIYRIHTILQNVEQSQKPYEEIILGISSNTTSLISELKRLSSSIKRKIDELTKQMTVSEILEHFTSYNNTIISQAYYRLKTSENISHFRPMILARLDSILTNTEIMQRAIVGYKIVNENERNPIEDETARERIIEIIDDVKYNFRHLDDIIEGIDTKNTQYIKNAVNRAQFLLTSGTNTEGKLSYILKQLSDEINADGNFLAETTLAVNEIFSIYPQRFISDESLRVIPIRKDIGEIDKIEKTHTVSEEERKEFMRKLKERNERIFSRKNINSYVMKLLEHTESISVTEIPVHELRDFIRIIYIVIYSSDSLNCYGIKRGKEKVTLQGGYMVNDFTLVKREVQNA